MLGFKLIRVITASKRMLSEEQFDTSDKFVDNKKENQKKCTFKFLHLMLGPILPTRFNLNPEIDAITFIEKHGMKLLIHSQTSTVQPLKFGNG